MFVEISSALFNLVILQYYQQSASSAEKQKSWALPIRFVNEYVDHKEYVELSQACLTDERILTLSDGWLRSRSWTVCGICAVTCGCLACCCGVCSNASVLLLPLFNIH